MSWALDGQVPGRAAAVAPQQSQPGIEKYAKSQYVKYHQGDDGWDTVYNAAKAGGIPVWCGGMLETGIGRSHNVALSTLDNFTLPGDTTNFRVNIGVRTLGITQFSVNYYEGNGGAQQGGTIFKSYATNYFEQVPLSSFLNDQPLLPGGVLVIRMISGDAIIYASTTDNRTNDTSATILKPQS